MSKNYINEAISLNGKIAYNVNNVSFKTNSVQGLLQHLAWQFNDTFVGTLKKVSFDADTEFIARSVLNLSNNGTPLVFSDLSDNKVSFNIGMSDSVYMLHMQYTYIDKPELMEHVNEDHIEFIVMIVNGIWFVLKRSDNEQFFDKFDEIDSASYTSTDLPTVKLPKAVSMIDNISSAKSALRSYAKENSLKVFAVSSFVVSEDIEVMAQPSVSKYASFAPDINEFVQREISVHLPKDTEIPYLVDTDNERLIFLVIAENTSKWYIINNKSYVDFITKGGQNFFIDSVKNSIQSAELNQGLKTDKIYENIIRNRAVAIMNNIQEEFSYSGYFYVSDFGKTLNPDEFTKVTINEQGFVQKVYNTKNLVLYKDTIVTYSANVNTGVVIFGFPKRPKECFVTMIEKLPELNNEFYVGNKTIDTVLSISDVYFTDTAKRK